MRKIRRTLIPLLLMASVFATSVFAAPSQSELESQKKQAEKEMKSLQAELTELMTEIGVTEQKLIATGEAIIDATERLEEAEENEKIQHDNMMKRIVAMYESGSASLLQIIMESGSIADMLQRMENVQAVHEYDRKALEEYVAVKEEIAELKVTLEEEQASLETLEANLTRKQATLNNKIAAKKEEVDSIQADIDAAIAEAARLAAEEADRKRREETEQNGNQIVISGGTNSNGGVKYTGTGDTSVGQAIVAAARTYLGVDYVWGGNDYNGIDCSGLTKAAHKAVGIYIDRWSGHQAIGGKEIASLEEALPGDIICYPGHVAIYIGNYRIIHAPRKNTVVKEASVYLGGTKEITAIRRYW